MISPKALKLAIKKLLFYLLHSNVVIRIGKREGTLKFETLILRDMTVQRMTTAARYPSRSGIFLFSTSIKPAPWSILLDTEVSLLGVEAVERKSEFKEDAIPSIYVDRPLRNVKGI